MYGIKRRGILFLSVYAVAVSGCSENKPEIESPNIILIMTDDQGFGDLGFYGNPHIHTPVLDNFARESIRFDRFYASPVCAPTRASLLTGRYSLRTGVRDTFKGGSMMATEEVTIAEMLQQKGYSTGLFGKWHLGDNYPFRPNDQGFDESLMHLAGGMGQPGDFTTFFKGDSSYFDPVLWYNGEKKAFKGYCSDIFTEEAITFIEKNHQDPFFCFLSFNAPHTPLQVPGEYYDMYKDIDPSTGFDDDNMPFPHMSEQDKEDARKVYAMVSNVDDNVGKLLQKLDELGISDNTLVIFMSDNGPQQARYVAGMRGRKSSVYRGGVRVPFFFRLPSRFEGDRDIETVLAHIDLFPTLAELCGFEIPTDRTIDGISFLPILEGNNNIQLFEKRPLFFYWTRRYPELYNNIALQKGPYKLVGHVSYDAQLEDFELYNLQEDEYELHNIISSNKALALEMKFDLDYIIQDVSSSPHLINQPRIIIGSEQENPVYLNRNDASGPQAPWRQDEIYGYWRLNIKEGTYNIRFAFLNPIETNGSMYLETNSKIFSQENIITPTESIEMKNMYFSDMQCDFIPYYLTRGRRIFPLYVELEKVK